MDNDDSGDSDESYHPSEADNHDSESAQFTSGEDDSGGDKSEYNGEVSNGSDMEADEENDRDSEDAASGSAKVSSHYLFEMRLSATDIM